MTTKRQVASKAKEDESSYSDTESSESPLSALQDTSLSEASEAIISVADEEVTPPSFADRLKSRIKNALGMNDDGKAEEKPKGRSQSKTPKPSEFYDATLPLMGMILCWALEAPFPEPYKPVAPTRPEGENIIAGPMRMLDRRVKASKMMGPDQIDILLTITAIGLYADRARHTFQEIRLERAGAFDGRPGTNGSYYAYQAPVSNHAGSAGGGAERARQESNGGHDDPNGSREAVGDAGGPTPSYPTTIADLLQQDYEWRRDNGAI